VSIGTGLVALNVLVGLSGAVVATVAPLELRGNARSPLGNTPVGGTRFPLDDLLALSAQALPGTVPTAVTFPERGEPGAGRGSIVVRRRQPGELSRDGNGFVVADAASGHILTVQPDRDAPFLARLRGWALPLHRGDLAGWPSKMLYALIGLGSVFLTLTGCALWGAPQGWRAGPRASRIAR
jgi:uncharacterized iron-regulated membrane protein